ncbi:uncharacterized protein LOC127796258 [Diospyros lotus]|uniref:uncharacterized protein LOC127796258 n=1 Tax=Diospyros lotus TaxID=55363 RepID=UPI00224D0BC4|nr:uncharacterized protein LOC127796258 [Diospyros lotus]
MACFHWAQPSVRHSPSSPQTLASRSPSPSPKRRSFADGALVSHYIHGMNRSALFGQKFYRSKSSLYPKTIKRVCRASLEAFSDEEFSKQIRELAARFQISNDDEHNNLNSDSVADSADIIRRIDFAASQRQFDPLEPPDWAARETILASIERRANSVELPLSLRMIKRKKQWQEGFREAGESACCSFKKAFSSMVFIIRELHSFALRMREKHFYEDLQEILLRVQKEMNASFVWLFQQVFSHTPTLMVYVMILLANYSVYSMTNNAAAGASLPPASVFQSQIQSHEEHKFDSRAAKTFSVSSSSGKTTSIGGSNGGGGKFRPVASGTDGDGRSDGSQNSLNFPGTIVPNESIGNASTREDKSVSGQEMGGQELRLWNSIMDEVKAMQTGSRDDLLDQETVRRFVSPVTAKIESDDYADYFRTELLYQSVLAREPYNPLLLANYAQFLYLVARNYDRAEEYFKRAVEAEPPDAEAMSKYGSFLWEVRKDTWAAEERFLEAISADPSNTYYAANYAHFLWNTGGDDTCFPVETNPA